MPNLSQRTSVKLKPQLYARLRMGRLLAVSEKEFAQLILEVENDPIFAKLKTPSDGGGRAVFTRRFPHTGLSSSFYEVKDELAAGSATLDVEQLLDQHREVRDLIKTLGRENFENYFLYCETGDSVDKIAEVCGLRAEQVRSLQSFVLKISVHSEFFAPTALPAVGQVHYSPVARIEEGESGELSFSYMSPHLARGRYVVNRERLENIKQELTVDEKKALLDLVRKVEWVNLRADTLHRILTEAIMRQELYLRSGEISKLHPLSQREMARRIGMAPSTVSRTLFAKSIILLSGRETALKTLFPGRKELARNWLADIIQNCGDRKVTDEQLKEMLLKQHRLKVSRRSVNLYRRSLGSASK